MTKTLCHSGLDPESVKLGRALNRSPIMLRISGMTLGERSQICRDCSNSENNYSNVYDSNLLVH